MSSGFLADNNRANNKFTMNVELDKEDPLYGVKLELINADEISQSFNIRESIIHSDTFDLISWLRYSCYNEEQAYLVLARTQAINTAQEKYLNQNKNLEGFD